MKYEELVFKIISVLTIEAKRCKGYLKKGQLVIVVPEKIPYKTGDNIWEITIRKKQGE